MTRRYLLAALLAAAAAPGAGAADPPAAPPVWAAAPAPSIAASAAWAPASAAHLRVYVLDGVNPLGVAGTGQLAERLRRTGFPRVEVAGWYGGWWVERDIRRVYAEDPAARFAVVGYSAGAYAARGLAARLVRDGVPVAVVGYVGGDYLSNTPATQLPGVGRVVNVTGEGYLLTGGNLFFNGTSVTGATNVRLAGTWHYGLPSHPTTFAALFAALAADGGPVEVVAAPPVAPGAAAVGGQSVGGAATPPRPPTTPVGPAPGMPRVDRPEAVRTYR